ncbi:PAS domain-containing sensor histidine kinase [Clostridium sp. Marseille-Q2269]|uniref:PAS domain-containing sensor histidine kinase n=1 Tax=Clostridium sp. Marseille-Q2269 TaxID=2942205 RepID=UPI002074129E|nr:PAS domain-containing sensor histidine kinase [Clostridium sp. Marseille-Q2269]
MEAIGSVFLQDRSTIKSIIDSIPYACYIVNDKYDLIYVNNVALDLSKELKRKSSSKLQPGEEKTLMDCLNEYEIKFKDGGLVTEKNFPVFIALKEQREIKEVTLMLTNISGKNIYFNLDVIPINLEGTHKGALINLRDITKECIYKKSIQKDKKEILNISEEIRNKSEIIEALTKKQLSYIKYLNNVINNISEGIMVFDKNSKLILCNKAIEQIAGMKVKHLRDIKDVINQYDIYTLDDVKNTKYEIKTVNLDYKRRVDTILLKLVKKDSNQVRYIEYNSNPIKDENGEISYTISSVKDVTDLTESQITVEERAEFIKYVVDCVELPLAVLDYPNLTYKLVNERYEQLVERLYTKKIKGNLYGHTVEEVFTKEEFNEKLKVLKDMKEGEIKEHTFSPTKFVLDSGEERFYKIKYIYHEIKNKKRVHIHGSDVTEEFKSNIELEEVNKLKDEFFTIISHELRTPLTIIYSSLQLAYDIYSKDINSNIDKILKRINQNTSRLLKLINNILDISKAEAGFLTLNNEYFDIVLETENIVNSIVNYASCKNINLIFDTTKEEEKVCIDKEKYEKILLNLLSNAAKFTQENKSIYVSIAIYKDSFKLIVKDEGIGIPKDKIDCIFNRFAQVNSSLSRNAEGTGIGLSLVKKIVDFMGGEIKVDSTVGKGTTFTVKINKNMDKSCPKSEKTVIHSNISKKIHIEFSDIN